MCPQLMSAWAAWRAWERWSGRSGASVGRRRRGGAPSGGPTVRRIWGISVDGVGADGVRTTALSVHSSMHTQHELMSTEGLPGLPRRRGHGAEAKCVGRAFIGAVTHFQVGEQEISGLSLFNESSRTTACAASLRPWRFSSSPRPSRTRGDSPWKSPAALTRCLTRRRAGPQSWRSTATKGTTSK